MATTKGRLGRGLSALIPSVGKEEVVFKDLNINEINPNPKQPRKDFNSEAFTELVGTIKQIGIIQPVVVRQTEETYEIIAGERRWRAAKKAGLKTIPCVVKEASEATSIQMALIENIQRQDLTPIEEANAYNYLLNDGGFTQEKLAKKLGTSRPYITNTVRLLRLPNKVKDLLSAGKITSGHARALASLKDEKKQISLAKKIVAKGMSVRLTEKEVEAIWHPIKTKSSSVSKVPKEQEELNRVLGLKVSVKQKNGGGVVSIYYENQKQLSNFIKIIKKRGK